MPENPEYRFKYRKSLTLDNIFLLNIDDLDRFRTITINKLAYIDPAYAFVIKEAYGKFDASELSQAVSEYADRYGISNGVEDSVKRKKLVDYLYK